MSLTRQFLREFRPLFRMLEEPFGRSQPFPLTRSGGSPLGSLLNDPFFRDSGFTSVPAVDVAEEPNAYIVEAELPGVKKENVDVRIGDNGQSLTIEGRTFVRSGSAPEQSQGQEALSQANASATEGASSSDSQALTQTNNQSTQLSTERTFTGSSQFSRTIWLPRPVDGTGVTAKLADGILTVRIPKAEDKQSVRVDIQ